MARLRYVDLSGTIASGNLTNSATSHTFTAPLTYAAGVTVPTLVSPDYFMLSILNTAGTAVSEVVRVTAYNSGTGAATIARGKEGTTGVAHTSADKVLQSAYPSDLGNEAWENAVSEMSSGLVHRWKCDESSGATINDSVGTLHLTLNGSAGSDYTRNITGPPGLGIATHFVSSNAVSSGLGSLPIGANDRTFGFVYRCTSDTTMMAFSYGTNGANTLFYAGLNEGAGGILNANQGGGASLMQSANAFHADGDWHIAFVGVRNSGKTRFVASDRRYESATYATAIATGTGATNFTMGRFLAATSYSLVADMRDMMVWNRGLTPEETLRFCLAMKGNLP